MAASATTTTSPPPPQRRPTLLARLSCASYIYFIPVFLVVNVLCLCNRYTAVGWLL